MCIQICWYNEIQQQSQATCTQKYILVVRNLKVVWISALNMDEIQISTHFLLLDKST